VSHRAIPEHGPDLDERPNLAQATPRPETVWATVPTRGANPVVFLANALTLQKTVGNRAAATLLAPRRASTSPTGNRSWSLSLQREPTLTLVDHGSGLSEKELKIVVGEAQAAISHTTSRSKDRALKKSGVKVRSHSSLSGIEALRKKGDMLVYLIHDIKADTKREKVVREILTAEGALKGTRLNDVVKLVTGDLGQGQHVRDRASNVAFINLDLITERGPDSLRAIAGDVLHEGIGHRAIPAPAGESTYHNPKDKGVMSEAIRQKATKGDILFQEGERDKVNEFLKNIAENPDWNKD
jgi:hypothetical protein